MGKNLADYHDSLYKVAALVNSVYTPEMVLRSVVEDVTEAMGAKGCLLMLLTPDRESLLPTAAYGLSSSYARSNLISAERAVLQALGGKPATVFDVTRDEELECLEELKREGIVSIICVPVTLRQEIIGVMQVCCAEPRQFTADDIFFAGMAANLGAVALEQSQAIWEFSQRDYETDGQGILEWRAALGTGWIAGGDCDCDWERQSRETCHKTIGGEEHV